MTSHESCELRLREVVGQSVCTYNYRHSRLAWGIIIKWNLTRTFVLESAQRSCHSDFQLLRGARVR